jgi:hypothetical protein
MVLRLSVCLRWQSTGWAQHQVETAADFSGDSLFWAIVSSGASQQVRHLSLIARTSTSLQLANTN